MSTQQPEALRLADECGTGYPLEEDAKKAAAELRRLHAEVERLKAAALTNAQIDAPLAEERRRQALEAANKGETK
ncbi:hypothetical protein UFOVP37_4 [uncultured Caudovirales phage]|uniref:Uncharacterized protein n=1 Tax=uncultured Caudovirales phage TaxID=2100421 RepID=A0A6J5KM32_9CAUD|nr:hypothetical protein UFOVP37_4 [uncultured Caudovirales phage]